MKILWIINNLTGEASELFYGKRRGGLWIDNYLEALRNKEDLFITVVTSKDIDSVQKIQSGNVKYCLIPGGDAVSKYNPNNRKNQSIMKEIIDTEKPEIIHIWGTESALGVVAQTVAPDIKSIVLVQGVVRSLERYCLSGISLKKLLASITIRGLLKRDSLIFKKVNYCRSVNFENRILRNSYGFIYENDWCYSMCSSIAPNSNGYRLLLPVASIFEKTKWNPDVDKKRIMCPFMYDSFKGFHILIKAFSLVKKAVPDAVLVLPGDYRRKAESFFQHLKIDDYSKLISKLIEENNLQNSIEYPGYLSAKAMAKEMSQCNIFVMCSTIENHASTLKEAMTLGMPCIASNVGGVFEYAKHDINSLLYRCEDYELLAFYMVKLLNDRKKCEQLANRARMDMLEYSKACLGGDDLYRLYNEILLI